MGIALIRMSDFRLNLVLYTGRLSGEEGLRFYDGLDPDDPTLASRWLTWIDDEADFTDIPLTAFAEVKHALMPKLARFAAGRGYRSAVVCDSPRCDWVIRFWREYVERDPSYVSHPELFTRLEDACVWLELPPEGCEAVAAAIGRRVGRAPAPRRRRGEGETNADAPGR